MTSSLLVMAICGLLLLLSMTACFAEILPPNYWNAAGQVAYSGDSDVFVAANWGSTPMDQVLSTGMSAGRYCDIISGKRNADLKSCTGKVVVVDQNRKARFTIATRDEDRAMEIRSESKLSSEWLQTAVFIKFQSRPGQDLFLRGGISTARKPICSTFPSQCVIPLSYSLIPYNFRDGYKAYNTWLQNDTYLDWQGREPGQPSVNGKAADGTPMVWTTNSTSKPASYNEMNRFGDHYWMLNVMMDCSATDNGWFEVKGFVDGTWEANINQNSACSSNIGFTSTPFKSNNHIGRCGFKNVFVWNQPSCQIDHIHS